MSISRIKPFNWAVNEKLTSAQINQIDNFFNLCIR